MPKRLFRSVIASIGLGVVFATFFTLTYRFWIPTAILWEGEHWRDMAFVFTSTLLIGTFTFFMSTGDVEVEEYPLGQRVAKWFYVIGWLAVIVGVFLLMQTSISKGDKQNSWYNYYSSVKFLNEIIEKGEDVNLSVESIYYIEYKKKEYYLAEAVLEDYQRGGVKEVYYHFLTKEHYKEIFNKDEAIIKVKMFNNWITYSEAPKVEAGYTYVTHGGSFNYLSEEWQEIIERLKDDDKKGFKKLDVEVNK